MVEPPELPKDITSSGQMDSGEQKESRESADLKVDLKGVVRSETESQVIVKGVAGKAKAPIPQEVEQLQRDEDDPSPVHVWKGPSTDGAFSYHSKGRCARKQNAQNPAESNVVTQFHTEDRWETKTESSASFHSKGRRSAAPVVDERAEEVVQMTRNEKVVKKSSGSYMSFHRRPMAEPEPVYMVLEDLDEEEYDEEPERGDIWSRVTESMVEHHNRRPRTSDVVDDDYGDNEEEVYERLQSWGEIGESSMHFHSRGRRPVGRRIVVRQWHPEEYEIIETPGTIIKRGTGSSLSFHSTGRRRLVKKESVESPVESQPRQRGNVISKKTESSLQFHHKRSGESPDANSGNSVENEDTNAVCSESGHARETTMPSSTEELRGDVWSRTTESMVEHHNRRGRPSSTVPSTDDQQEQSSEDEEVQERWGEVGPSSMHFHSRGRRARRCAKQQPLVDPEEQYYYETSPINRHGTDSSITFHGGKRRVIAIGPREEVYEVSESPKGRIYRQDTGSMIRYHFRKQGEPEPMNIRELSNSEQRSIRSKSTEFERDYQNNSGQSPLDAASMSLHFPGHSGSLVFNENPLKEHILMYWTEIEIQQTPGAIGSVLFDMMKANSPVHTREFADSLLHHLRESKGANGKDVNLAAFFTELHMFLSRLTTFIKEGNQSPPVMLAYDRLYEFAQTVQSDLIGTYVRRNSSDIIAILTNKDVELAKAKIIRRMSVLESPAGRLISDIIITRTDMHTVNLLVRRPYLMSASDATAAVNAVKLLQIVKLPLLTQALNIVARYQEIFASPNIHKEIAPDLSASLIYFLLKSLNKQEVLTGTTASDIDKLSHDLYVSPETKFELSLLVPSPQYSLVALDTWNH